MTTATATPTTDERIAARRAALTKERATRKDELDLPRTMTTREMNAYVADTAMLDKEITALNHAVETWAALPTTDADEKWRDHVPMWRETISAERLAIKSPIRDRERMELAQRLEWSIKLIDNGLGIYTLGPILSLASSRIGELMAAAGYSVDGPALRGPSGWRGTLSEVEARIKTVTRQRVEAQAALDVLLRSDEQKAQQETEDKTFREVMNTMHCRISSDGKSLVAFSKETDDPLVVADMTPVQRQAFERFEAAHFGRPRETVTV